jgi:hypothetical protein
MKSLSQVIIEIQDTLNEFDGTVSIKDAHRKYFFANDAWLNTMHLESDQVIGKTDDEIAPVNAEFIRKTDQEVAEKKIPIQYINTAIVDGKEITYIAIKWVVYHQSGEPFCYCTIAHLYDKKDNVLAIQAKINSILDTDLIDKTDYTHPQ